MMVDSETSIDKQPELHKKALKKAWLIRETKVVSFHEVEGSELYEAEEDEFWKYIISLMNQEYRMQ